MTEPELRAALLDLGHVEVGPCGVRIIYRPGVDGILVQAQTVPVQYLHYR